MKQNYENLLIIIINFFNKYSSNIYRELAICSRSETLKLMDRLSSAKQYLCLNCIPLNISTNLRQP